MQVQHKQYIEVPQSGLGFSETATIWNNGKTIYLSDNFINHSSANSIYVTDSDVFVVGLDEYQNATLWKNGTKINLSDCIEASSVSVSGSDVYVAGVSYDNNRTRATLWKNGVKTILSDTNEKLLGSWANSVFTVGLDVWVVGKEVFDNGTAYEEFAVLWKNGSKINLSDGTYEYNNFHANSLYVFGSDVYIAGTEVKEGESIPVLWKNGVKIILTHDGLNCNVTGVYASNSDIYVTGNAHPDAILWKNGVKTILNSNSAMNSIYISGSDVYVVGSSAYDKPNISAATIWKNGNRIRLSDRHGSTANFVTRKDSKGNNSGFGNDKMTGATVSAPQFISKTHNSITITAATFTSANSGKQTIEYGRSQIDVAPEIWQDGLTFIGLNANTTYYIFARSKENITHNAGIPSMALFVTTNPVKTAGEDVDAPTLDKISNNSITINAVSLPGNGQTIEYAKNTTNSAPLSGWQDELIFTGLNSNTQYFIFARSKADLAHNAGTPSDALIVKTHYKVGDTGPGGGKIFYYDPDGFTVFMLDPEENYIANHLEVAPTVIYGLPWASAGYTSTNITGTSMLLGTGRRNTSLILAIDKNSPAANINVNYLATLQTDWFLPSVNELSQLYSNMSHVNIPTSALYWSSTQYNNTNAWFFNFSLGFNYDYSFYVKSIDYSARGIRAF